MCQEEDGKCSSFDEESIDVIGWYSEVLKYYFTGVIYNVITLEAIRC